MQSLIRSLVTKYLILSGLAANALFVVVWFAKPEWIGRGREMIESRVTATAPDWLEDALAQPAPVYSLDQELADNFAAWTPLPASPADAGRRVVDSADYATLQAAAEALEDRDVLRISEGVYQQAIVLRANNVVVEGVGHVVLDGAAAEGKAAIVNKGSSNTIRNLECRNISVRDRNGACVRQEGENVRIEHVYFHSSEQGLLGGRQAGLVELIDVRFERLGSGGRSHGVYVTGGELIIRDSLMLASRSEGHEVKSRATRTVIERSVIASLSSVDSRLLDISEGGVFILRDSVLQEGPGSVNQDVIGYSLERGQHDENRIEMSGNLFLLERPGRNVLLHRREERPVEMIISDNVIVASQDPGLPGSNRLFETREEAGLAPYPFLPSPNELMR